MKRLYVLYDGECTLCARCRRWLEGQPKFVEMQFIPLQRAGLFERFPGLEKLNLRKELTLVTDEGAIYRGASAWIMCLYALRDFREWSQRLASPALRPLARSVCEAVSANRIRLGRWMLRRRPDEVRQMTETGFLCQSDECRI